MSVFIVLEGIDGSGKSSVAEYLEKELENVIVTREPSDSPAGKLAGRSSHEDTPPHYDFFLYLADRLYHTTEIKRWLNDGKDVICDRYWGSTSAYQAASGEISLDYTIETQRDFVKEPDLTILFDLAPEESLERISHREKKSKYENMDYLDRVRDNYLKLAEEYDWTIIDAGKELEDVKQEVLSLAKKEINR